MRRVVLSILAISILVSLFLGYEAIASFYIQTQAQPEQPNATNESMTACPACPVAHEQIAKRIDLRLPAVDRNKKGALANLTAESGPGNGRVFVRMDSDTPLVNPETQDSLRSAIDAARWSTGIDLGEKNIYYSIASPSDVVGGKSAGAAIAVATMAILLDEELKSDVIITGTIQANGSIGPVGEILAKAAAAKEAGYVLFLVPPTESTARKQYEKCEKAQDVVEGGVVVREVCRTTIEMVNVSDETGIQVIEVANVTRAFELMKK